MIARRASSRGILSVLCAAAMAVLVAACGEDERPNAGPVGSPQNPVTAQASAGETEPATRAAPTRGAATRPSYDSILRDQKRRPAQRFTPCNLVTKTQAQAILRAPIVAPREAPQGPTCIYQTRRATKFVTLAVQSADIADLKRQLHRVRPVVVSSRKAYCGRLGQALLYVPLGGQRVLSIAAPCPTAQRFATAALTRIKP